MGGDFEESSGGRKSPLGDSSGERGKSFRGRGAAFRNITMSNLWKGLLFLKMRGIFLYDEGRGDFCEREGEPGVHEGKKRKKTLAALSRGWIDLQKRVVAAWGGRSTRGRYLILLFWGTF